MTVPAEIILRIVEITSVEPVWLLRGEGPKFRARPSVERGPERGESSQGLAGSSVATLLRTALERLEQREKAARAEGSPRSATSPARREDWDGVAEEPEMDLIDAGGDP